MYDYVEEKVNPQNDRLQCPGIQFLLSVRFTINNFSGHPPKIMKYNPNFIDKVPQCFLTELLPTRHHFALLQFIIFHTGAQVNFEKYTTLPKIFQRHPTSPLRLNLLSSYNKTFHLPSATFNTLPLLWP